MLVIDNINILPPKHASRSLPITYKFKLFILCCVYWSNIVSLIRNNFYHNIIRKYYVVECTVCKYVKCKNKTYITSFLSESFFRT